MIAINILGDGIHPESFDLQLSDIYFGHQATEYPLVLYASNIIGPKQTNHTSIQLDGTALENKSLSADDEGNILNITMENLGQENLTIDDISISSVNNNISIENFEPLELEGHTKSSFDLRYAPTVVPDVSQSTITVSWYNEGAYKEILFQVAASASCVRTDHINSNNLNKNLDREDYKAINAISSNASIGEDRNMTFSAGQEIGLNPGFEVVSGSELNLIAKDECTNY